MADQSPNASVVVTRPGKDPASILGGCGTGEAPVSGTVDVRVCAHEPAVMGVTQPTDGSTPSIAFDAAPALPKGAKAFTATLDTWNHAPGIVRLTVPVAAASRIAALSPMRGAQEFGGVVLESVDKGATEATFEVVTEDAFHDRVMARVFLLHRGDFGSFWDTDLVTPLEVPKNGTTASQQITTDDLPPFLASIEFGTSGKEILVTPAGDCFGDPWDMVRVHRTHRHKGLTVDWERWGPWAESVLLPELAETEDHPSVMIGYNAEVIAEAISWAAVDYDDVRVSPVRHLALATPWDHADAVRSGACWVRRGGTLIRY